jgi:hypothetical protein
VPLRDLSGYLLTMFMKTMYLLGLFLVVLSDAVPVPIIPSAMEVVYPEGGGSLNIELRAREKVQQTLGVAELGATLKKHRKPKIDTDAPAITAGYVTPVNPPAIHNRL